MMKQSHSTPFASHEVMFLIASDPRSQEVTCQWIDTNAHRRTREHMQRRTFECQSITDTLDREWMPILKRFTATVL
jgi:hypothetical protein